ncbi:MAG: hypothetical protein ACOH2P_19075 [Pseudomonas sp.]
MTRRYQQQRDPESLLIEAAAKRLAEQGYPLPTHDPADDAESILREAIERKRHAAKDCK